MGAERVYEEDSEYLVFEAAGVVQTIIRTIPADQADVERLLRRIVTSDGEIFVTDPWGNVTLVAGDETLQVRVQETTWQGMFVPRPEDRGVQFLSICEAESAGDGHRRLMDIQIYRLDQNRSSVALTRYTDAAPVAHLHRRMVERIRQVWFAAPSGDGGSGQRRRGGRPRNEDDDWAWHQVNMLGRAKQDVYREWQERIGERLQVLSDPRRSFNGAVDPTRGPGQQGEK